MHTHPPRQRTMQLDCSVLEGRLSSRHAQAEPLLQNITVETPDFALPPVKDVSLGHASTRIIYYNSVHYLTCLIC